MDRTDRRILLGYGVWAAAAVGLALLREGLSANNITRLAVIAVLAVHLAFWWGTRGRTIRARGASFIWRCALGALLIELCYMISRPVFASLTWQADDTPAALATKALLDCAFTFPAYLVIYAVSWSLLARFRYRLWHVLILFPLGQALGDGNAFFLANPAMLLLAPYVMLNYQAILAVPVLRVRAGLTPARDVGVLALLAPLVLLPVTYWVMGALIIVVGRRFGLA